MPRPVYICRGASGCCRRCCGDDDEDDDDDYDEDRIRCCCTQNLCAKIFFVIFSFFVFVLGLVIAAVAVNVNFVDSSIVLGEENRSLGDQWHGMLLLGNWDRRLDISRWTNCRDFAFCLSDIVMSNIFVPSLIYHSSAYFIKRYSDVFRVSRIQRRWISSFDQVRSQCRLEATRRPRLRRTVYYL